MYKIISGNKIIGIISVTLLLLTNIFHIFPYTLLDYLKIPTRSISFIVKSPMHHWASEDNLYGYMTYRNQIGSPLGIYIKDLIYPVKQRTKSIVDYLKQNAEKNDVFLEEGIEANIIIFYTDLIAANRIIPNANEMMKRLNAWEINEDYGRDFTSLTQFNAEDITWIISGTYFFPSTFRLENKEAYEAIRLEGTDYYMFHFHEIDYSDFIHSWEKRIDNFKIYKRINDHAR